MANKPEKKIYRTAQIPAVRIPAQKSAAAAVKNAGIYRVFNIVFAAVFGIALVLAIVFNPGAVQEVSWYWLLLAAVLGMAVAFGASRLFMFLKTPEKKGEIITVAALMVVLAALQVFFGVMLRVQPVDTGNFGLVYNYAADYALTGTVPDAYFLYNPTHGGLYTLLTGFFSLLGLFGVTDFVIPALILNILAVDGAVLMLYFCARRLFGQNKAIFLLVLCIFCLPLYLFIPIFYTATFSMPVVVGILLLWLRTRAAWRAGNQNKAWIQFGILSAVAGLGALVKTTVLIVWIAAALDFIILLAGKGRWKVLLSGLGIVAVLYAGGFFGLRYLPILPKYDSNNTFPASGWVLMGLQENGGFNENTYEGIIAQDGTARSAYASYELGKVLSDPLDVLGQLGRKIAYTYGDGTYEAPLELDRSPIQWSFLHDYVLPYGASFAVFYYVAFALHAAMLGWMIVAAVKAFSRKNNALTFVRVALFGLYLFLLLWKTGPGELVNFIPLFLLCALEASPMPRPKRAPRRPVRETAPAAPAAPVAPVEEAPATPEPALPEEPVTAELPVADTLESILDDLPPVPVEAEPVTMEIFPEEAAVAEPDEPVDEAATLVEHTGYQPYEPQAEPVPEIDYADYVQAMPEDMYELRAEDSAVELAPEEAAPVADLNLETRISPIEVGGGADWMLAAQPAPVEAEAETQETMPEYELPAEPLPEEMPAEELPPEPVPEMVTAIYEPAGQAAWDAEAGEQLPTEELPLAEDLPVENILPEPEAPVEAEWVTETASQVEAMHDAPAEAEAETMPEVSAEAEVEADIMPNAPVQGQTMDAQDEFAEFSQWLEAGTPPIQQGEAVPQPDVVPQFEQPVEEQCSEAWEVPVPDIDLDAEPMPEAGEAEPSFDEAAPQAEPQPDYVLPDWQPISGVHYGNVPQQPAEAAQASYQYAPTEYSPDVPPQWQPLENVEYEEVASSEQPLYDVPAYGQPILEPQPEVAAEPEPEYVQEYEAAPVVPEPEFEPVVPEVELEFEPVAPKVELEPEPELEPVAPEVELEPELEFEPMVPNAVAEPEAEFEPAAPDAVPESEAQFEPETEFVPEPEVSVQSVYDIFADVLPTMEEPITAEPAPEAQPLAPGEQAEPAAYAQPTEPAGEAALPDDKPDLEVQDEFQVGDGLMGEVEVWNAANSAAWTPEEGQQLWPPIIPGLFEPTEVPTTIEHAPQQPPQDAFDLPTIPQEDEWPVPQFPPVVPEVKTGPPVPLEDEDDEKSLWDFI